MNPGPGGLLAPVSFLVNRDGICRCTPVEGGLIDKNPCGAALALPPKAALLEYCRVLEDGGLRATGRIKCLASTCGRAGPFSNGVS